MPTLAWSQVYDPFSHAALSTFAAAAPIVVLLGSLAILRVKAHWAAILGLATALVVATLGFGMPTRQALTATGYGAAFGLLPIGWIILNVIFLYNLTEARGLFDVLKASLTGLTDDRRLQLLLIAFSLGAFFEGAAGFGTPVAVTAAILIGLGFSPLAASGLSLIANTAPVAFGALGTPIIVLHGVTGIDLQPLSAMVGRQLPLFSLIVPAWLVCAYAGLRGLWDVWPAVLFVGASFAATQFLMSNFHGPWLVDVVASVASMATLLVLLRVWKPRRGWPADGVGAAPAPDAVSAASAAPMTSAPPAARYSTAQVVRAWVPWVILCVFVFVWGLPSVKTYLDGVSMLHVEVRGLHQYVQRMPPVVPAPQAEPAVYTLNWLSTTGTGIFAAAIAAALVMGCSPAQIARTYWATICRVRASLLTVAAMLALGYLTRYAGLDATLGLAFARTGALYPFFGTLLGWLGVALTGSDTSSNVLFGSLQQISAARVGVSPVLMASANSAGGVMGKMIDAQSIVVASTATRWYGHEGAILRYVFLHSLTLAALVGVLVLLQAYVWPFTAMVVR